MSYLALYREWRPQSFSDIVGQAHITKTVQNAINAGRIAHAYLFCGPRGTGKTTTAKVLAKAVNCAQGPAGEPCNECEICKRITEGNSMDVLEIDAASNRGIDEIRDLREKVKFSPTEGRYRIYIIDEVHMLTTEAFNALLKTLEEPPRHVLFILATTEPHKIPSTILSRCQRFDFKRIGLEGITNRLREVCDHLGVSTDEETLNLLAKTAEGGMRDALSTLDQCISFGGNKVSVEEVSAVLGTVNQDFLFKMTEHIINRNSTEALFLVNELVDQGKDLRQFSKDITEHFRNLLLMQVSNKAGELIPLTEHTLGMLEQQAKTVDRKTIMRTIGVFSSAEKEVRWSNQPRMIIELAVIEACSAPSEQDINLLLERIETLEKRLATGVVSAANINAGNRERVGNDPIKKVSGKPDLPGKAEQIKAESEKITETKVEGSHNIDDNWPRVMEKLKKTKRTAHAFLIEGTPAGIEGHSLVITFPDDHPFHKENIEKQENKLAIEAILHEIFGQQLKVKCKFASELSYPAEEQPSEEDPLLEKAIQLFGESVIELND